MYKLNDMRLSNFRFDLPNELIAQFPKAYRDDSRLMVVHRTTGEIEHKMMKDILAYFDEGDVFVFNDTATFPARLYGKKEKTNAEIEIFLLRELHETNKYWDVLVEPARKIRIGNKIVFDEDPSILAEVIDNTTSRGRTFRFLTDYTADELRKRLYEMGTTPLPRYITRPMDEETYAAYVEEFGEDFPVEKMDVERYQSIFAKNEGAVAAPATCLHFSKQLLKRMEIYGIESGCLTSHVNLGNFKAVDVEDLSKHKVESEQLIVSEQLTNLVNTARSKNKRVCAVGSEVLRGLEQVSGTNGRIKEYNGWTNKFIYPPYTFSSCSAFMANFYFPLSSQQLMVVAFAGPDVAMAAYEEAVKEKYRFGDYGDAMLIID